MNRAKILSPGISAVICESLPKTGTEIVQLSRAAARRRVESALAGRLKWAMAWMAFPFEHWRQPHGLRGASHLDGERKLSFPYGRC